MYMIAHKGALNIARSMLWSSGGPEKAKSRAYVSRPTARCVCVTNSSTTKTSTAP